MNQPIPTGPDLFAFAESAFGKAKEAGQKPTKPTYGSAEETYQFQAAAHHGRQANTAAIVMLAEIIANASGVDHDDLDAWREKIGMTWLKECRGQSTRRPECAERHTEDCTYADPIPEPKHELLPVGTRVLVSDWRVNPEGELRLTNPQPGRISGHAAGGHKYRWQYEFEPGIYSDHDQFAFADNRVEVHPDGPECPPAPKPVKREPTGPRMYVQRKHDGKQGHIVGQVEKNGQGNAKVQVQWHTPGAQPVWVLVERLEIILPSEVHRCPNGQTGDECGSGESQCERCLADEDAEAEAIEGSMNV